MKYILKVLFAGFVAFVVLLVFVLILARGCTAGLDQATKEVQRERHKSVSPSSNSYRRLPTKPVVWKEWLFGEELVREARPDLFIETSDWKVTRISRKPSREPDRSREYNYSVWYQMPNGATALATFQQKPLTAQTIRDVIAADIEDRRKWSYPGM